MYKKRLNRTTANKVVWGNGGEAGTVGGFQHLMPTPRVLVRLRRFLRIK